MINRSMYQKSHSPNTNLKPTTFHTRPCSILLKSVNNLLRECKKANRGTEERSLTTPCFLNQVLKLKSLISIGTIWKQLSITFCIVYKLWKLCKCFRTPTKSWHWKWYNKPASPVAWKSRRAHHYYVRMTC